MDTRPTRISSASGDVLTRVSVVVDVAVRGVSVGCVILLNMDGTDDRRGRRWTNFEFWANERVGVTVDDVVAQYRKEGLLLSDAPNEKNCWEITDYATWYGQVPPLTPEAVERRRRCREDFLATWDGSIGAVVYPDRRRV